MLRRGSAALVLSVLVALIGGGSARAECQFQVQELPVGTVVISACASESATSNGPHSTTTSSTPLSGGLLVAGQGAIAGASGGIAQERTSYDSGKQTKHTQGQVSTVAIVPAAISIGLVSVGAGAEQSSTTRANGSRTRTTTTGADAHVQAPPVNSSGSNVVTVHVVEARDGDECTQMLVIVAFVADQPFGEAVPVGDCAAESPDFPDFP